MLNLIDAANMLAEKHMGIMNANAALRRQNIHDNLQTALSLSNLNRQDRQDALEQQNKEKELAITRQNQAMQMMQLNKVDPATMAHNAYQQANDVLGFNTAKVQADAARANAATQAQIAKYNLEQQRLQNEGFRIQNQRALGQKPSRTEELSSYLLKLDAIRAPSLQKMNDTSRRMRELGFDDQEIVDMLKSRYPNETSGGYFPWSDTGLTVDNLKSKYNPGAVQQPPQSGNIPGAVTRGAIGMTQGSMTGINVKDEHAQQVAQQYQQWKKQYGPEKAKAMITHALSKGI